MKRLLALAFVAACAPSASASTAPLSLSVALDPPTVGVGDAFVYTVEARVDSGKLDARNVRLIADTGSFATVGPSRVSRSSERIRLVQTLACLDRACAPLNGARRVTLPAPRATASGRSASGASALVRVVPRVPSAAVRARRAEYRKETTLPAPTTSLAPGWAGAVAALLAAVFALAAAALLVGELRPRQAAPWSTHGPQSRLARALRLLRESAARSEPDRRRAADFLARAVAARGSAPLADEATRVAWSARRPAPPDAETLASHVEQTLGSERDRDR